MIPRHRPFHQVPLHRISGSSGRPPGDDPRACAFASDPTGRVLVRAAVSSGQQVEPGAMGGAHGPEATLIKGRDLGLVETLREGDHAGIDHAEAEVGVATLEFEASCEVDGGRQASPGRRRAHQ